MSDYLVKRGLSPFGLRRNLFAFGMTMTAIMLFATAYAPNPYVAIAALSLAGASLGFSTPSLWTALVEVTPKDVTGTMGGVMNFGGNLAGIVVSILTSYILDITNSFFIALLMASIMALLGAISTLVFVRPKLGLDPQMETEQYMIVLYELQPASLLSQRS